MELVNAGALALRPTAKHNQKRLAHPVRFSNGSTEYRARRASRAMTKPNERNVRETGASEHSPAGSPVFGPSGARTDRHEDSVIIAHVALVTRRTKALVVQPGGGGSTESIQPCAHRPAPEHPHIGGQVPVARSAVDWGSLPCTHQPPDREGSGSDRKCRRGAHPQPSCRRAVEAGITPYDQYRGRCGPHTSRAAT